jgi:hypothetical protein
MFGPDEPVAHGELIEQNSHFLLGFLWCGTSSRRSRGVSPMSALIDPQVPEDSPRGAYHYNLVNNESMNWYSATMGPRDLVKYVFGLLDINIENLLFDELGFATTPDKDFFFTVLAGPAGSIVSVAAFGERALAVTNQAIGDEYDAMMAELSRGEFTGAVGRSHIKNGELVSDHFFTANPKVFDIINVAEVVPVFDAYMFNAGAKDSDQA